MVPAEHQPIDPIEERGVVVTALRKIALALRRAWIAVCRGLAVVSFIGVGAASLFWVESFFAEYEPSDVNPRVLPLVILVVVVTVPASLISGLDFFRRVTLFLSHALRLRLPVAKSKLYLPAWVLQATLVLFLHSMINIVLYTSVSAEGSLEVAGGSYFVVSGDQVVRNLTAKEAHLWLGLSVAAFTSMFGAWLFFCGMFLWTHLRKLKIA
jgi:hypothetical protein